MTERDPNVANGQNDASVTDLDRAKERARTAAQYEHTHASYRQLRDTRPNATVRDKDIVDALAECIEIAGEYGNITAITDLIDEDILLYKNGAAQTGTINDLFEVACAYWHWGQFAKIRGRDELAWYLYNMEFNKAGGLYLYPLDPRSLDKFLSALDDGIKLSIVLNKLVDRVSLRILHFRVTRTRNRGISPV